MDMCPVCGQEVEVKDNTTKYYEGKAKEQGRREIFGKFKDGHCAYAVWNGKIWECWGFDNPKKDGCKCAYETCPLANEG